jgi:hypothetical protein
MDRDGKLVPAGEHAFSESKEYSPFFEGQGIEIFRAGGNNNIYTLICTAKSPDQIKEIRNKAIEIIRQDMGN